MGTPKIVGALESMKPRLNIYSSRMYHIFREAVAQGAELRTFEISYFRRRAG